jgi:non-homologous end joining protein Ku
MENGLVLHFMYFANEVRDFGQIPKAGGEKVPKREIDLGKDLIEKLSAEEFEPKNITMTTESGFWHLWSRKPKARKLQYNRQHQSAAGKWLIFSQR